MSVMRRANGCKMPLGVKEVSIAVDIRTLVLGVCVNYWSETLAVET